MEVRPSKGLKVKVNARREAIFGEDSVSIQKIALSDGGRNGVLTGICLAGFCEVEMQKLDARKHWFPMEDLEGERGERVVEEERAMDPPENPEESDEE